MITEQQIADYAAQVEAMRATEFANRGFTCPSNNPAVAYEIGRRYARLFTYNGGNPKGSVIAFIDLASGDLLKPASYKAPAKHRRGNIVRGLSGMGPYGVACLR